MVLENHLSNSSLNSRQDITQIVIKFREEAQTEVDKCFTLVDSYSTNVKTLKFVGDVKNSTAMSSAFRSAQGCPNLRKFVFEVDEFVECESEEGMNSYRERRKIQELKQTLDLESLSFASPPTMIRLSSSVLTSIKLGKSNFFTRAKTIELKSNEGEMMVSQHKIFTLLKLCSKTLRRLKVTQKFFIGDLLGITVSGDQPSLPFPLQLPRLKDMEIQASGSNQEEIGYPIIISAPRLLPNNLQVNVPSLIVQEEK